MGRFANSWKVFKQSLAVLKHDKELLLLPIISGIASLIVLASFVFPMYFTGLIDAMVDETDPNAQYYVGGLFFLMYLILAFITIYFNAGVMYAANIRMEGGDPSLGDALKGPTKNFGQILLWSIFFAVIGLLIRAIEAAIRQRAGAAGAALFGWIAGAAWWMATYFAVPVVLFERKHVGPALKQSVRLFKQRWGETLIGHFGMGLALFVIALPAILAVLLGIALASAVHPVLGIVVIAAAVLWFLFVNLALGPALNAIYKTALYRFATKGVVAPAFTPDAIQGAWTPVGQTAQPTYSRV